MRQVEASAKTREEAIQIALGELGVEMYEVDNIEILDEGSRGVFGLGARPVRVRVRVDSLPDEPRKKETGGSEKQRGRQREENRSDKNRGSSREREDRGGNGRGRQQKRGGKKEDRPGSESQASREGQPHPKKESRPRRDLDRDTNEPDPGAAISDEQGNEAAAMLQQIIAHMGIEAKVDFDRAEDSSARLNVASEDSAILIGRKGRNLSAMQYLINRIVSRNDTAENTERLVVDVAGYIERRRETLEDMARNFAEKARKTGRNMRLKPLSPQERRIIHLTLQNESDIRTFSLGDSLYRSVIISAKDSNPSEGGGRGGRRGGRGGRGGRSRGGGRSRQNQQSQQKPRRDNDDDFDAGQFGD
jgi:spoIIIJ-associated protein